MRRIDSLALLQERREERGAEQFVHLDSICTAFPKKQQCPSRHTKTESKNHKSTTVYNSSFKSAQTNPVKNSSLCSIIFRDMNQASGGEDLGGSSGNPAVGHTPAWVQPLTRPCPACHLSLPPTPMSNQCRRAKIMRRHTLVEPVKPALPLRGTALYAL